MRPRIDRARTSDMNKHIEIALIATLLIVTVASIVGDVWLAGSW